MKYFIPFVFLSISATALAQEKMAVDYAWKLAHKCAKKSPEISVTGIPLGSVELSVKMVDLDYRSFDHGGGFIKNDEGLPEQLVIAEGSLTSFVGPCPPNFSSFGHDYEITVTAKDKNNQVLGKGSVARNFSAKSVKE
jgi:phosphatidylethanolamine-binding protein (PEBP) family uncharacterized protein